MDIIAGHSLWTSRGLPIPEGWAFDADGQTTTSAAKALDGLLHPIGGYKGTGLALVMGILSTLLPDASYGTELGNMTDGPRAGQDGHFFLALRIGAFVDILHFKQRVDQIIRQIQGSRRAPGFERVYPPGHLEAETEQQYHRDGIPLNSSTLRDLMQAAIELGVDVSRFEETIVPSEFPVQNYVLRAGRDALLRVRCGFWDAEHRVPTNFAPRSSYSCSACSPC